MGMYSSYNKQDIKILNKEALRKLATSGNYSPYDIVDGVTGDIHFCNWDDNKIEGYWYNETREALLNIAPYISGWVEFHYEEGYDFRIVFEKGIPYVQYQPDIDWSKAEKIKISETESQRRIK